MDKAYHKLLKIIESKEYCWTLTGNNNAKLSAASLFSKCAKVFENHHIFDTEKLNYTILKYKNDKGFYIDGTNVRNHIIAESRQALSGLINNGINNPPNVELSFFYKDPNNLYFMNDQAWDNPWDAGAQLSHYLFF